MGMGLLIGGTIAAAAFAGYTQIQNANDQADAMRRQAEAERQQANQENKRSYDAFHQGEVEARRRSQQLAQLQGANRVSTAGQGLLVGEGGGATQADVYATNAANAATDIDIITSNAKARQDQYDISAANRRAKAAALEATAKETEHGAKVGAALNMGLSLASAGLGAWGLSSGANALGLYQTGLETGNAGMRLQGLSGLVNSSLIKSGGSLLSGIGGGRLGQSIYNSALRYNEASYKLDDLRKGLGNGARAEGELLKAFGY